MVAVVARAAATATAAAVVVAGVATELVLVVDRREELELVKKIGPAQFS
jgi:hypothetical protein